MALRRGDHAVDVKGRRFAHSAGKVLTRTLTLEVGEESITASAESSRLPSVVIDTSSDVEGAPPET